MKAMLDIKCAVTASNNTLHTFLLDCLHGETSEVILVKVNINNKPLGTHWLITSKQQKETVKDKVVRGVSCSHMPPPSLSPPSLSFLPLCFSSITSRGDWEERSKACSSQSVIYSSLFSSLHCTTQRICSSFVGRGRWGKRRFPLSLVNCSFLKVNSVFLTLFLCCLHDIMIVPLWLQLNASLGVVQTGQLWCFSCQIYERREVSMKFDFSGTQKWKEPQRMV